MKKYLLILIAAALALFAGVVPTHASTVFTVNSAADKPDTAPGDGKCHTKANVCTLRAAIQEANALGGNAVIHLAADTYQLKRDGAGEDNSATGDLDVKSNLKIVGKNRSTTTIKGKPNWQDRIFHILSGSVTLARVAISGGNAPEGAGILVNQGATLKLSKVGINDNSGVNGGGISNHGWLILVKTVLVGNEALDTVFGGGGIDNYSMLYIEKSVLSYNTSAGTGGGIFNRGNVSIVQSEISYNTAAIDGGGLYVTQGTLDLVNTTLSANLAARNGGGIYNRVTTGLYNVTVADNIANSDNLNGGVGGGIYNEQNATLNLKNSILNQNDVMGQIVSSLDCAGTLTSLDYNLVSSTPGCALAGTTTHNKTNVDAKLGPLQNNGGPTDTHAVLGGSPAFDAIPTLSCTDSYNLAITQDQRGAPRPEGAGCEMGAFEVAI